MNPTVVYSAMRISPRNSPFAPFRIYDRRDGGQRDFVPVESYRNAGESFVVQGPVRRRGRANDRPSRSIAISVVSVFVASSVSFARFLEEKIFHSKAAIGVPSLRQTKFQLGIGLGLGCAPPPEHRNVERADGAAVAHEKGKTLRPEGGRKIIPQIVAQDPAD